MCTFCFSIFSMLEKEKRENMKNMENEDFKKDWKNSVFRVVVNKKDIFFAEMAFLKLANAICVRKVKKERAFSLQLSVLGKWSLFVPIGSHQTLQKQGFQQARRKTQNGTFGCKSAIWVCPPKGALLSVINKGCALLKTLFL